MTSIKLDLDKIVQAWIITEEKKAEILDWHKANTRREGIWEFVQILASFWAIIIGLGVILLIAANWDDMADMTKTMIMVLTTLSIYAIGYYWTYKNTNYPKTGESLIFLWSILYGASIFLIGQIYNLWWTFSDALLIWAIWIIPLAYTTGFVSIFLLGIALIYWYILGEVIDEFWISGFVVTNIFLTFGYLSLSVIRFHENKVYKAFWKTLSWTGGASMLGWLFSYTFIDFWKYGGEIWYWSRDIWGTMWILFWIIAVGLCCIIYDIVKRGSIDKTRDIPLLLGLVPIGLIFLYTLSDSISHVSGNYLSYNSIITDWDIIRGSIMNLLYISIIGLMIWVGVRQDNKSIVDISMIFFMIYLFGKYLAFAFDSKMDGAFIFIWWGVVCIITTFLVEKVRRRIRNSMN